MGKQWLPLFYWVLKSDGDRSHEIKRHLPLGRKVMANLDSIFKNRDITLPTEVHLVKALVFPVVMYGCESWTVMKAEHRRIDAFELWWWRRLLRVPWIPRRSNQFILKEISPEYLLERLMLKQKLQYFAHLMRRTDSLEKTLMLGTMKAGGDGDDRGWDVWMASPTWWTGVWISSNRSFELVMDRVPWCAAVHGFAKSWTRMSDWTELIATNIFLVLFCLFCFYFLWLHTMQDLSFPIRDQTWALCSGSVVF